MLAPGLSLVDGAQAGAWIAPRLEVPPGSVAGFVPTGYEAYARIFHPASDLSGHQVTWREVADEVGSVAHSGMQWPALVKSADQWNLRGSQWPGQRPWQGDLDLASLSALCELIAVHTSSPERCFFGLSTITGWADEFSPDELASVTVLELPAQHDHLVLTGRLASIDEIGRKSMPHPLSEESEAPSLIWPHDRAWYVLTEADSDSTLIGGTAPLIDAVITASKLEAFQIRAEDWLGTDEINVLGDAREHTNEPTP